MTGKTQIMKEFQDLKAENDLLREQNKAMKNYIEGFCDQVLAARLQINAPKGGQSVTVTNPFARVMPSVMNELLWWSRALKQAATGDL